MRCYTPPVLVFIDESGHPHRNDANPRPVVVAVCVDERAARRVSGQIYGLKQQLLPTPDIEIKARGLLNARTFRRIPEKREFVEAFFDLCGNLPLAVFSIAMHRPEDDVDVSGDRQWLPNQFRYLLQRAHHLAEAREDHATVLFDGDGSHYGGLPARFDSFLFRSAEGRSLTSIADAPYYVDSRNTVGIQIADMFAGVVRVYEEHELFRGPPPGDAFLSAVRRYYRVLESLSEDLTTEQGRLAGMYRMPERAHYPPDWSGYPESQA